MFRALTIPWWISVRRQCTGTLGVFGHLAGTPALSARPWRDATAPARPAARWFGYKKAQAGPALCTLARAARLSRGIWGDDLGTDVGADRGGLRGRVFSAEGMDTQDEGWREWKRVEAGGGGHVVFCELFGRKAFK